MSGPAPTLVARPLAGRELKAAEDGDFVIAEWIDDGSMPGQLIAPLHVHLQAS